MLGTGENGTDFSHALCPASNTGTLGTFASFRLKFFAFSVLHTLKHTAWACGAAGSQVLHRVLTVNDTAHLGLCDNALLALAQDTGLSRALPFEGAVIGTSFIGATFAALTAGAPLFDGQGTVS